MTQEFAVLDEGSVLGSYRLVREIARGGMGTVYEAQHTLLPRSAAVKVMHADLLRLPGMATRMAQEAAILEHIRHPGIVRVFDCALLPDHRPWIAMELVDGHTLSARIAEAEALSGDEVAQLLANVADVLASVHVHGIVHRDLKPDNLLLMPHDRTYPVRVIDWGIAQLGPKGKLTLDGVTPGTPIYMSPEQATGRSIAAPCDIYSLGVIAYEALCGEPPFGGKTLAEVVCTHLTCEAPPLTERCAAPVELCALVHHMLVKDPIQRPTAAEVQRIACAIAHAQAPRYDDAEMEMELEIVIDNIDLDHTPALAGEAGEYEYEHDLDWTFTPSRSIIAPRRTNDAVAGELCDAR